MTPSWPGWTWSAQWAKLQAPPPGLHQEKRASREGHCPELVTAKREVFNNFQPDLWNAERDRAVAGSKS